MPKANIYQDTGRAHRSANERRGERETKGGRARGVGGKGQSDKYRDMIMKI